MNYSRLVLAALGAFVAYFAVGFLSAGTGLAAEYAHYPAIYRSLDGIKGVMPIGMAATFVSMLIAVMLYAQASHGGRGAAEGARFGLLLGAFAVCAFVLHNYVNLNIGLKLTIEQAVMYLVEWTLVGIVIGLIYRPAG